jgi:hypothetical protein
MNHTDLFNGRHSSFIIVVVWVSVGRYTSTHGTYKLTQPKVGQWLLNKANISETQGML